MNTDCCPTHGKHVISGGMIIIIVIINGCPIFVTCFYVLAIELLCNGREPAWSSLWCTWYMFSSLIRAGEGYHLVQVYSS